MRFSPNPGGGPSKCRSPDGPCFDQICPFHGNKTARLVHFYTDVGPQFVKQVQYTQGHIVVDHLQRRTACHV